MSRSFLSSRASAAARAGAALAVTGLVALAPHPAAAQAGAHRAGDPVLTVTAGGDRAGSTSVGGLAGVRFEFYAGQRGTAPGAAATPAASCVTGPDGRCSVDVPAQGGGSGNSERGYWIIQREVPGGWFASPGLDTGAAGSIAAKDYARLFAGNVTANISVPVPVTDNAKTATARGSVWAASRDNPPLPDRCGLRVALLFDLSGSIGSDIGDLRRAGVSFVRALTGTPSSVAVYTFASKAPANTANNANLPLTSVSTADSAAAVTAKINGLTVQTTANATNWDSGLWQIAADPAHYDVALVLTDGNPTVYGPSAQGPGSYTRFIEVENGIFSANALKARRTAVLGVGIGNVGKSTANLASISGPQEGTDYFATDFAALPDLLTRLALKNCQGTVNVVKQVVPASSAGDLGAAVPAPGWHFRAEPGSVQPAEAVTDGNGAVSFATRTSSTQPVTITETQQPGYHLIPVDGKNARCKNSAGQDVPVTDTASGPGFTVDAVANHSITCEVFNQEPAAPDPASVLVTKSWNINGVTVPDGDQDPGFQAGLTLDPVHPAGTQPSWGTEYHGYQQGDQVTIGEDRVSVPPGCTVQAAGGLGGQVLAAGLNTFQVMNTVSCDTRLTLVKQIRNPFPVTPAPLDAWTLTARTAPGAEPAVHGTTGVTGPVSSGTRYVLAESTVPGYRQDVSPGAILAQGASGSWQCTTEAQGRPGLEDFSGADGTVTVPPGQHAVCTAVNEPDPARLTLVKKVVNDHGGSARPQDWTLHARPAGHPGIPAPSLSGATGTPAVTAVTIPPGVPYALSESGPGGYDLTSLDCAQDGQPVAAGPEHEITAGIAGDITCTFTNTQSKPGPTPSPSPTPTSPSPTPTSPAPSPSPTSPGPSSPRPSPSPTRPRPGGSSPGYPMPGGGAGTGGGTPPGGISWPLLAGGASAVVAGAAVAGAALLRRRRTGSILPR